MNFNYIIRQLQSLINEGKHGTPEYLDLLKIAQKANPNKYTPVGFYLDGPRPYTMPNGSPVRD